MIQVIVPIRAYLAVTNMHEFEILHRLHYYQGARNNLPRLGPDAIVGGSDLGPGAVTLPE
jgi:hypothetical protein